MSRLYNFIAKMYRTHVYTKEEVATFVAKGQLTASEYEQIVGESYPV